MPGTMENLGLVKDGKITPEGKKIVIQRIKNILSKGGENSPFPCKSGKNIPPVPPDQSLPDDIEDEEKYPDFHSTILKQYENVLIAQNQQGNFAFGPPFIDPVALAQALKPPPGEERAITDWGDPTESEIECARNQFEGLVDENGEPLLGKNALLQIDISGNIPRQDLIFSLDMILEMMGPQAPFVLSQKLGINSIELIQKLALPPTDPNAIIKPPLPQFNLPIPPVMSDPYLALNANISLPVPAPGFTIPYPDKIEFDSWQLKLPKFFAKLLSDIISDPTKLFKLIGPEPEPCFIIDAAEEIGLFGTPESGANVRTSVQKDLMTLNGQATAVNLVAKTIGDGGKNGATGILARKLNLATDALTTYGEVQQEAVATENYKSEQIYGADSGGGESVLLVGDEFTGTHRPSGLAVNSQQAQQFRDKLIKICKELGVNPDWLAIVMWNESKIRYDIKYKGGTVTAAGPKPIAMGYIGFHTRDRGNWWQTLYAAGPVNQLDYVKKYFVDIFDVYRKKNPNFSVKTVGDLYCLVAGIDADGWQKGRPKGHSEYQYYEGNVGFDLNKDGLITRDEIKNKAQSEYDNWKKSGKRVTISGQIIRG